MSTEGLFHVLCFEVIKVLLLKKHEVGSCLLEHSQTISGWWIAIWEERRSMIEWHSDPFMQTLCRLAKAISWDIVQVSEPQGFNICTSVQLLLLFAWKSFWNTLLWEWLNLKLSWSEWQAGKKKKTQNDEVIEEQT